MNLLLTDRRAEGSGVGPAQESGSSSGTWFLWRRSESVRVVTQIARRRI